MSKRHRGRYLDRTRWERGLGGFINYSRHFTFNGLSTLGFSHPKRINLLLFLYPCLDLLSFLIIEFLFTPGTTISLTTTSITPIAASLAELASSWAEIPCLNKEDSVSWGTIHEVDLHVHLQIYSHVSVHIHVHHTTTARTHIGTHIYIYVHITKWWTLTCFRLLPPTQFIFERTNKLIEQRFRTSVEVNSEFSPTLINFSSWLHYFLKLFCLLRALNCTVLNFESRNSFGLEVKTYKKENQSFLNAQKRVKFSKKALWGVIIWLEG